MDAEQTIAEIESLERIFAVPDTRPLSAERPLGCESETRRFARAQSVVSPLAALWSLLALVTLLRVPQRMRRPAAARKALSFSPLVQARRADASSIEGVPFVSATTRPSVFFAGRPAAQWASDARIRRLPAFSFSTSRSKTTDDLATSFKRVCNGSHPWSLWQIGWTRAKLATAASLPAHSFATLPNDERQNR